MAYTPNNNPYIPGDPYSYDLKWLICQLKKHSDELSTLDERILKAVMQTLDQHDPIYFKTADEMINSGMQTEALAYIEGYHTAGDGGENLYYTTSDYNDVLNSPYYITLDGANRWAIPVIIAPWITPQMFGAYGDGEHDDTDALNATFINAHKYRRNVYIPAGEYDHTGIVIYGAAFGGSNFLVTVRGASRSASRLVHTGAGTGVEVKPYENAGYVDGITLEHLSLQGGAGTVSGLLLSGGTRYQIREISVDTASQYGIRCASNMWLSSFTDVYAGNCATGISLRASSNTSLHLDKCYVMYATANAYDLQATYSDMGILAADHCAGDNVFNLYGYNGNIECLASENASATRIAYIANSNFEIANLTVWNADTAALDAPVVVSSSKGSIHMILTNAVTAGAVDKNIARLYRSFITIDTIKGNQTYNPVVSSAGDYNSTVNYNHTKTKLDPDAHLRPYIGYDKSIPAEISPTNYKAGAAFYLNCSNTPRYLADGSDFRWSLNVTKGDWFIENDPLTYGAAAYVMLADGSGDANAFNYGFIPVLKAGTTANRPATASLKVGTMYFDTTLGKPIFYKGSGLWIDATGTTV